MRILKLKAPVLALLLASAALLLTLLFIPVMNFLQIDLLFLIFAYFYFPAELAVFLCSSDDQLLKGVVPKPEFPFFLLFVFLQWYLIIFVSIVIYRHYHKKVRDVSES